MIRFFVSIFIRCTAHKKLLMALLALLLVAFGLALTKLKYKEDIAEFLPDNKSNKQINTIYRHIGNSNKLMIYFSQTDSAKPDVARIMEAIDGFAAQLTRNDSLHTIPEMLVRIDESNMLDLMDFIRENVAYFLTETDYRRMDTLLTNVNIAAQLRTNKQLLMLPSGAMMKKEIISDPLHLFTPLWQKISAFRAGDNWELNDGYLFSVGGKKGMITLTSPYGVSETNENTILLALVDKTIKQTQETFTDINISYFGAPAIAVSNAAQIKNDSWLAISLSAVLILLLLIYFFRNVRNILLVFCSTLFGWLFALTLLVVFNDSISIIAIGISSIFIGIAVNYPLHFIDHTRRQPNVRRALKEIASPLLIGNITTVSAFLSLVFIRSNAMRDMGLFGSLLLIGTILFVLLFLPHLIKPDRYVTGTNKRLILSRLAAFAPEQKKWIAWIVLLLTAVFSYLSQYTTFEPNMNAINYMTDQQRADMHEMTQLLEKQGKDVVYFVSEGATLDEALSANEQNTWIIDSLKQRGWIANVSGTGTFLASAAEQQRRIDRWNHFWQTRKESLLQQLDEHAQAEGFRTGAFDAFTQLLQRAYTVQSESYFAPLIASLAENYLVQTDRQTMLIQLLYCDKDNTAAVEETLNRDAVGAFAFDARDMGKRLVEALSADFNYVLFICGFIVFLFLTLSFGRLELSLMAFLPLAVSWIWILGIMQLAGISFNIVNIILATFIFGQGDDYTIFIADGLIYEYAYRRRVLASYKNSILLSSLIMFVGIGTLIFAKHPALRSLAEVTIIGMFSVVLTAYVIPPLIFQWLTHKKGRYRQVPVTLLRVFYSVFAFSAFLIGSILLTTAGFLLFAGRQKTERRRMLYHTLLCRVARFVVKRIPGVPFRLDNLAHETFDKPSVIIANHQSHLDLMCLLMLTPRMVILTNEWVWRSPFYGLLIRYADFYPVGDGFERCVDKLADRMQNGYSVVIFPEGTRSENAEILRFRRGAFYLAETLKADILPVVVHGAGDALPKNDFMLRKGRITVSVYPRITTDDDRYGSDALSRAKSVRRWYRETFAAVCKRTQDADYYSDFVRHNYYYKGADVERSVRTALKTSGNYARWIDGCRNEGDILVVNSGLGEFAFLLALTRKRCRITTVDRDADKVALARACAGTPPNLHICDEKDLTNEATFDDVFLLCPDDAQEKAHRHRGRIIAVHTQTHRQPWTSTSLS